MRIVILLSLSGLVACSSGTIHSGSDGSIDSGSPSDAGRDAGGGTDAGVDFGTVSPVDAGPPDTGPVEVDAGPPDLGPPDSGFIPCPGGPLEIDLHSATIYANPPDLADWPVTTRLTEVDFNSDGLSLQFDKKDGPGRWPDIMPPTWTGPLQYTLGMVECIDGQWYASAVIEFWYGLDSSGGNVASDSNGDGVPDQVALNWYYDAGRWGMLAGRQPATGETIGIFVAAGNLRNITTDDPLQSSVMERSNVVLVPMPDASGATHSF